AIGAKRAARRKPRRKDARGADRRDLAEMEAEAPLELGVKFLLGQRDDARRRVRLLGPHDRRTMADRGIARQRQDRERPGREKMLLGAPAMVALVRDGSDDGGLAGAPTMAGDARALANRRTRAVGAAP